MADLNDTGAPDRPVRWRIALLAVLVATVLSLGALTAARITGSIDQLIAETTAARLQAAGAQALVTALRDAETGQRGYLLTARLYYLEPYYRTLARIDDLLATMARRAAGVPWLEPEARLLTLQSRSKLDELHRIIQVAQRDGFAPARAMVMADAGKTYMDEARATAGRIIARAEAERAVRADMLRERQQTVTFLMLAGMGAGVLLLGAALIGLLLNADRLRRARAGEVREALRLAAAIEHVPDGVAVFDGVGRLTLVNSRFCPVLGLAPALGVDGTLLGDIAAAARLHPAVLAGARPAEARTSEARQDGQGQTGRTFEVWRSPMPDGGQMLAVTDITRRVAAEEVARQAQKMDVLGQMTGGVAHDFNNLLQVVSANLELVRTRLVRIGADAALLARLDAASAGVGRGARLTRHLLAFARRQPLAPEPLDPARLLMGMEEVLRRTLGESVALEMVVGGGLWTMRADPTQFENALLNLALNARDAMTSPDGLPSGKVTIEAANASLDAAYAARVAEVTPGQYVMFAVTDTGAGMTQDQVARAVEPFYTTKPIGRGTGLGLPMVLGFAKQSGGHFQLYSEPGHGTTARVYIPRTTDPLAQSAPAAADLPAGRGELVLLVEDDGLVRQAARDALAGLGYQVIEADSADAATDLLRAGCRPRVLFTDVVMPGRVTARQMAAEARTLMPDLAVLFTSGYTQNSIVHNGQLDPGVALLSKPWRMDELAKAVRAAIAGEVRPAPRRRALIVEDEELVRLTTADALADLGFEVVEAASAAAALVRMSPPPDLLLTDLGLPDQDGLVLVAEARRLRPGLPVIVVSGQSDAPDADVVWLPKPYDTASLREAVARALPMATRHMI